MVKSCKLINFLIEVYISALKSSVRTEKDVQIEQGHSLKIGDSNNFTENKNGTCCK